MPKVEISTVAEVGKKNRVDPVVLRRIIEELNLAAQPEGDETEREKPVKKQFVILVSDPRKVLPRKLDLVGWVLQLPEDDSVATTLDRIFSTAADFNASKKGRLMPVSTVGDALENLPAKFLKERELWVKTKTPVLILRTDNELFVRDSTDARSKI